MTPEDDDEDDKPIVRRLPATPTHHLPRTPGKIAVLQERAARGEILHHPDDAKPSEVHDAFRFIDGLFDKRRQDDEELEDAA